MELTSENVTNVFMDCLFRDEELAGGLPYTKHVIGEGITIKTAFNAERLESHKQDILDMVDALPPQFKEGWSFLNMCNDKSDKQWTGEHRVMEQLVTLGMATGKIKLLAPKEMWPMFPGGMPYYQVTA